MLEIAEAALRSSPATRVSQRAGVSCGGGRVVAGCERQARRTCLNATIDACRLAPSSLRIHAESVLAIHLVWGPHCGQIRVEVLRRQALRKAEQHLARWRLLRVREVLHDLLGRDELVGEKVASRLRQHVQELTLVPLAAGKARHVAQPTAARGWAEGDLTRRSSDTTRT